MSLLDLVDSTNPEQLEIVRRGPALYRRAGKRAMDLLLAFAVLPIAAPVIAILWTITAMDGGNGFFGHKRIGRQGKVFRCWKIRTMVVDAETRLREHLERDPEAAEEWARNRKLTNDPRITRFGDFLRRTSLDELPQIWNVIKGDMSFVGPRPVVRTELHKYGEFRPVYLSMKPGVTGLWQVSGRNEVSYSDRVQFDLDYSSQLSLLTDIRLIFMTGLTILAGTGR
jgi:lipopolysaccharide/colanic/teichoic acid biosynthesis glycosyltransferase